MKEITCIFGVKRTLIINASKTITSLHANNEHDLVLFKTAGRNESGLEYSANYTQKTVKQLTITEKKEFLKWKYDQYVVILFRLWLLLILYFHQ